MSIIGLLVALIIIGLLFYAVKVICATFEYPPKVVALINLVLVIAVVLWLLQWTGLLTSGPTLRLTQ